MTRKYTINVFGRSFDAKTIVRTVGFTLLVVIFFLAGGAAFWLNAKNNILNKVNYISTDDNPLVIDEQGSEVRLQDLISGETTVNPIHQEDYIHNIMLIGIDSRARSYVEDGSGHLADIIFIMSLNEKDNTIKLVSIARDCYAYVPGHSRPMKINAAMTYGGPDLLMAVVRSTLRIDINEYAYVNFYHMEQIIDALGGINVFVSESERSASGGLNAIIRSQNTVLGVNEEQHLVQYSGEQRLNGRQAVAYARIRYVGRGDFQRSERQVEVLNSMMNQFSSLSLSAKIDVVEVMASHVSTNISRNKIDYYFFTFLENLTRPEFEYLQIPLEGYSNQGMYNDVIYEEWSIRNDWNATIPVIQEFLYGETFPFDAVPVIPNAPVLE